MYNSVRECDGGKSRHGETCRTVRFTGRDRFIVRMANGRAIIGVLNLPTWPARPYAGVIGKRSWISLASTRLPPPVSVGKLSLVMFFLYKPVKLRREAGVSEHESGQNRLANLWRVFLAWYASVPRYIQVCHRSSRFSVESSNFFSFLTSLAINWTNARRKSLATLILLHVIVWIKLENMACN